uniref:Uncharacterized protein n=1 Tax=Arundo donax TaxID=35708 RepID=A0A0A8Y1N6_ARUDO
MVDEAGWGGAG